MLDNYNMTVYFNSTLKSNSLDQQLIISYKILIVECRSIARDQLLKI